MEDNSNVMIKEAFQEPRKRFWLRSRKRPKSDACSINSMDISVESELGKKKKRRRITEVANSIFSSTGIGGKLGSTLHSSFGIHSHSSNLSCLEDDTDTKTLRKKKKCSTEDCNNITLRSWMLDIANVNTPENLKKTLNRTEVKRQEAIYELCCGESVLINDLYVLKDFYYEPLLTANIFTEEELEILFSNSMYLIEVHSRLRDDLIKLRDPSGFTNVVGVTILNWLPTLREPYLERCRTQVWARHLLDEKKVTNKRLQGFLKRRLLSPHSVDLWTYLDIPRSRIVKYPLLVKEILKHTPVTHIDQSTLKESAKILTELLKNIDKIMGDAECELAQSKINIKLEYDPRKCIKNATELITEGRLKNIRGMKLHCFLFNTCFVITRSSRRVNKKYQLFHPVIPTEQLLVSNHESNDNEFGFKVADLFLLSEDGHSKRHWIDSFNKVNQQEMMNEDDKENQLNSESSKPHVYTKISINTAGETSSQRCLSKRKRNSIGYI